ncbi:MAG: hypothetical protein ACOYL5_00165 [Phototrophicaceae bacterium]
MLNPKPLPSETADAPQRIYTPQEILVRRVLFWLGIGLWVVILLIPFSFVVLAARGEFSIALPGDYPDNDLRVWMIMERDERGLAFSSPAVIEQTPTTLIVETSVGYLLWEGHSEPGNYCMRYNRLNSSDPWRLAETLQTKCIER